MENPGMWAWWTVALCSSTAIAQSSPPAKLINSFEKAEDLASLQPYGVKLLSVDRHATLGERALEIEFQPTDWPNIRVVSPTPWDWREYDGLAVDVTNPTNAAVSLGLRVDDDPQSDGARHCRTASSSIEPGATVSLVLNIGRSPMSLGMRGLPVVPGLRCLSMQSNEAIDRSHIFAFQVFMDHPRQAQKLILDNIRLTHWMVPLDRIVDEFGQYAKADWPGKVTEAGQFAERRRTEETELQREPRLPDRDRFGGWSGGPQLRATGYFRTEKVSGKWWLVTPEGRLFWSAGMDCVSFYSHTITTGREYMFSWLPDKADPLARHFGVVRNVHSGPVKEGTMFNFMTADLQRKYGTDYERAWFDRSISRLTSWGFNTLGNWSDQRLYRNGRLPYVATVPITGDHARISGGADWWGPMHDPYDPKFAANVDRAVRAIAGVVSNDPWCIGYFVDNELSWGGWGDDADRFTLARNTLAAPISLPAKKALLAQLAAKYKQVRNLNRAWGTGFLTWEAMEEPWPVPMPIREGMRSDLAAFTTELARRYFQIVHDALGRAAPHHLYLGCRFAWHTPEAVTAAAEFCDVVSFNIYKPRLNPAEFPVLDKLEKPCIVGEFHSGSLDRGLFHCGLVPVENQQRRGEMYQDYVRSVLNHPLFVGCHWFQYVDQPLTGRALDGENYNVGFVMVTDTPHAELVAAARAIHRQLYTLRFAPKP